LARLIFRCLCTSRATQSTLQRDNFGDLCEFSAVGGRVGRDSCIDEMRKGRPAGEGIKAVCAREKIR
jgi:hypothetical protein